MPNMDSAAHNDDYAAVSMSKVRPEDLCTLGKLCAVHVLVDVFIRSLRRLHCISTLLWHVWAVGQREEQGFLSGLRCIHECSRRDLNNIESRAVFNRCLWSSSFLHHSGVSIGSKSLFVNWILFDVVPASDRK
jgi:hypothetical protein